MSGCGPCGCHEAVEIRQCDDYLFADNRGFCFSSRGCKWPEGLTTAQLTLDPVNAGCACPFNSTGSIDGVVNGPECGVTTVCFELTCEDTCCLAKGVHMYNYRLTARTENGGLVTLDNGKITVR